MSVRLRLSLLATGLAAAFALPAASQAAPVAASCAGASAMTSVCSRPAPESKPAQLCPGRELLPASSNVVALRVATLCLVNEERTKRGLGKLRTETSLGAVAGAYAQRMVRGKFFDHTSPDGGTFLSRIKRTNYLRGSLTRWSVGENLAWGTGRRATPEGIVAGWMSSPGHRKNVLNARFHELGLGIAIGAPQFGVGDSPAATYVNEFGERRR